MTRTKTNLFASAKKKEPVKKAKRKRSWIRTWRLSKKIQRLEIL